MSRGRRTIAFIFSFLVCQAAFAEAGAGAEQFKRAYDYCFDASQLLYKKDTAGAVRAFQQYQSLVNQAFQVDPSLATNNAIGIQQKQAFCEKVAARLRSSQALPFLELANESCNTLKAALDNADYATAKAEWQRYTSARERAALISSDALSSNVVLGSRIKQCDKLQARLDPPAVKLPQSNLAESNKSAVAEKFNDKSKTDDIRNDIKRCNAVLIKATSSSYSAAESMRLQWKKMQKDFSMPIGNKVAACIDRADEVISKLEQSLELQQHVDSFRNQFDKALNQVQAAREACVSVQDEIKPTGNTQANLKSVAVRVKELQKRVADIHVQSQATDAGQRASLDVIDLEKDAFDTCVKSVAAKIAANEQKNMFFAELTAPKLIKRVEPVTPKIAKKKNIKGWVTLEYHVGLDGQASNVRIISASPKGIFEEAAVDAIRQWRFEPAKQNGHVMEVDATEILKFKD